MQRKTLTAAPADRATYSIARRGSNFTVMVVIDTLDGSGSQTVQVEGSELVSQGFDAGMAGSFLDAIHAMALAKVGFADDGEPYPEPPPPEPEPAPPAPEEPPAEPTPAPTEGGEPAQA